MKSAVLFLQVERQHSVGTLAQPAIASQNSAQRSNDEETIEKSNDDECSNFGSCGFCPQWYGAGDSGSTKRGAGGPQTPSFENTNAVVTFELEGNGPSATEVATLVRRNSLHVVETQSLYSAAGQTLTIGVPSSNGSVSPNVTAEIATTLQDLEDAAKLAQAKSKPGSQGNDPLPELIAAAKGELATQGVIIDRIVVSNVNPKLEIRGLKAAQVDARAKNDVAPSVAAGCGRWIPSYTNSTSASSSGAGRYNSLNFMWPSSNLSALRCTGSSTFEPDFVTYNYDGHYYFGKSMLSWSTTMPNGYWDTDAFDAGAERTYTVGSSNITPMIASTNYTVYIRMNNGNYPSDTAKIVWQRGHYTFACPSGPAWCIFSDESVIQYAWNIKLPGFWRPYTQGFDCRMYMVKERREEVLKCLKLENAL